MCLCLCSCVCSCVCVHVFVCVCVFQRREKREEERGEMRDKEKKMEIDLKKKTLFTHTHILSFTRTHILSSHSCSLSFPCLSFDRLSSRVRIISSRGLVAPAVARPVDCSRVRVRERKTYLELKTRPRWCCFWPPLCGSISSFAAV